MTATLTTGPEQACAAKLARGAQWRAKNPEKQKALHRSYYARHKDEVKARAHRHRVARRELVSSLKAQPCGDCGVSYPSFVMDFDHRPGEVKVGGVGRLATATRQRLLEEIAKCDVVCANCHRIRTATRAGWKG